MQISWQRIHLQVLTFRYHLLAIAIALCVWSWLNGAHKGVHIYVATETIPAGTKVLSTQVTDAWIDGADVKGYVLDLAELKGKRLLSTVSLGSPILRESIDATPGDSDRVTVSLPLEAGDSYTYPIGAKVHAWSLSDEGNFLLSADAIVLGNSNQQLTGLRIILSLPAADELKAMSALAVRLAIVSRDGEDG